MWTGWGSFLVPICVRKGAIRFCGTEAEGKGDEGWVKYQEERAGGLGWDEVRWGWVVCFDVGG